MFPPPIVVHATALTPCLMPLGLNFASTINHTHLRFRINDNTVSTTPSTMSPSDELIILGCSVVSHEAGSDRHPLSFVFGNLNTNIVKVCATDNNSQRFVTYRHEQQMHITHSVSASYRTLCISTSHDHGHKKELRYPASLAPIMSSSLSQVL